MRERVTANLDEESGIITISAIMNEPELSAQVVKYAFFELTNYLTEYRTEKVLLDLNFIAEQLTEAELRFKEAQIQLAEFMDANQGVVSARMKIEEQRLNSEYNITFSVYNSLTQQLEDAKIKVQETTPLFKVLEPIHIPVNDQMSGIKVLIFFIIISFVASVVYIIFIIKID